MLHVSVEDKNPAQILEADSILKHGGRCCFVPKTPSMRFSSKQSRKHQTPGPQRTYLFRAPDYDFLIYVLKTVGYLGSEFVTHKP